MNNIKFKYLYRDGANFKSWGDVVFSNPEQLTFDEVEKRFTAAFLPDTLFIASQISIPEKFLFLKGEVTKNDHCYHEFECVEVSQENPTDDLERSITDFLNDIELALKNGWKSFNILDRL